MGDLLRNHKNILYRLKRNFGLKMTVTIPITNSANVTTGELTRTFTTINIRRGILLPEGTSREFAYDLSYIASNKNFTYGGFFDKSKRNIILATKDLKGNVPAENWQCQFGGDNYTVGQFTKTEDNAGYVFQVNIIDTSGE